LSVILDTGAILALYDSSDDWHERMMTVLEFEPGPLYLPTLVIAETDYLLGKRLGEKVRLAFLEDIAAGVYETVELPNGSYQHILELNQKYATLELGVVDASVVVLSQTLKVTRVATIDRRHFVPLARMFALELLP
jgi:uncharacterized protein